MKHLKKYKLFESYPPNKFEIESERLFNKLLPDVKDIFLELIDSGVVVDVDKYIDDELCEFQISIGRSIFGTGQNSQESSMLKTRDQKSLCEESLFRLASFLEESGIHFAKVEMIQYENIVIQSMFGTNSNSFKNKHDIEMYELTELVDLENSAGDICLIAYFSKHND